MPDNSLITAHLGGLSIRDLRGTTRELARRQAAHELRQASADHATDLAVTKIESLTSASGSGMGAVARVGQALSALELVDPGSTGRMNFIADQHALAIGEVLSELKNDLRRI